MDVIFYGMCGESWESLFLGHVAPAVILVAPSSKKEQQLP